MYARKEIERKLKRYKERVDTLKIKHGDNPTEKFNYYGGFELGYWEGKLDSMEDLFDMLNEESIGEKSNTK